MSITGFGYAQARIQARHGQRPDELVWRRLHASRELGHFLEAARATSLRHWVGHLGSNQGPHEIERSLRADFRSYVREVASWVPEPWQRAVGFVERLPELPFEPSFDPARELEAWRALWPKTTREERRGLEVLLALLASHRAAMQSVPSESDGWVLSHGLDAQLLGLFRHQPEQPVTVFCHLAQTALDLERLRGALVRRALFADVESEVAWV